MTNQKARFKLTNTQLNKLKSTAQNKTETILRINKKNFQVKELPQELFLTTRQATKTRNAFANMSIGITVLNTKISEVENKILDTINLVTTIVLNTKISEVENKISGNSKYIATQELIS